MFRLSLKLRSLRRSKTTSSTAPTTPSIAFSTIVLADDAADDVLNHYCPRVKSATNNFGLPPLVPVEEAQKMREVVYHSVRHIPDLEPPSEPEWVPTYPLGFRLISLKEAAWRDEIRLRPEGFEME